MERFVPFYRLPLLAAIIVWPPMPGLRFHACRDCAVPWALFRSFRFSPAHTSIACYIAIRCFTRVFIQAVAGKASGKNRRYMRSRTLYCRVHSTYDTVFPAHTTYGSCGWRPVAQVFPLDLESNNKMTLWQNGTQESHPPVFFIKCNKILTGGRVYDAGA